MATITSRTVLPLREWEAPTGGATSQPVWHRSAPAAVARAESWNTDSEGWTAWSAHLAKRRNPAAIATLLPGKRPSLAWGMLPATAITPKTVELLTALDRVERGKSWKASAKALELATTWLQEVTQRRGVTFGLECLAWCRALPELAALLPGDTWWQLLDLLRHTAEDAATTEHDLLNRQWLGAELPLALAWLLPEIKATRELAKTGAEGLTAGIAATTSPDGMPLAQHLGDVRALLASWTRAQVLAAGLKKSGWDEAAAARYASFVQQVLRLVRRDGSIALSGLAASPADRDLFRAALAGAPRADRAVATLVLQGYDGPQNVAEKNLPAPAANNEAAGVTILRNCWSRRHERLTLTRLGQDVRTELTCGRDILWSGKWSCEVKRNGELLVPEPDAQWDEVCWTSTEDADYLEIEFALPQGIRVQRQVVLAREDRFLFLSDAVLGEEPATLEYRSILPLADDVTFDPSTESREGYLVGRKPRALLFPLALPEWRAEPGTGALEGVTEGLELRAARQDVRRLYTPLFLDLHPNRLFRPATWRQLTVAQDRQTLAKDLAVGFRVQVRDEHWLLYRSLGERGNRTVMGHNLVSDFLVARFNAEGEISPLVEIE